jgi:endonuclease G, mitochondrial
MAIHLDDLQKAASRFDTYREVYSKADPKVVQEAEARAAEVHRKVYRPAGEQLQQFGAAVAAGRPTAAPPGAIRPIITSGGVIPEIIQRDNDLRPVRFLHIAMLVARSVGRIRIADGPVTDEGDATGFLIAPGLLITNWHVLRTPEYAAAASVVFDDEDGLNGDPKDTKTFRLRPDLLYVSDEALDYAIVQVAPRTSARVPLSQYGYLRLFEQTGKLDPTQRQAANIIQHPGGGPKKIALRDNYFAKTLPDGVDPNKQISSLFYGTDTLKGSSGSPVCSDQWYVVALHRGGVPKTELFNGQRVVVRRDGSPAIEGDARDLIQYITNEGTRVSRIYHSLRQKAARNRHAELALQGIKAVATDPRAGPIDLRTAPLLLPALPSAAQGGGEEVLTRRKADKFANARGYRPDFLGARHRVPLPRMTSEIKRELAQLRNSVKTELKYSNYSLMMNRERRTAFFIAGNIDGGHLWKKGGFGALPKRPAWSFDPRLDDNFQPDDDIFSNAMQRGHLFKREDAVWGGDKPAMQIADEHSFTITNATPMIANFNNVEWGDLEDIVTRESENANRVSYFAGPVFRSTDIFFNQLRRDAPAADRNRGMRVPQSFWKIVAWVEDSRLKAAGFILHQTDEIAAHGPIAEEINFGTYRQRPISEIEQATGLRFAKLVAADTATNP